MKTLALVFTALIARATAQTVLTNEHVDLGINFNSAALAQPGGPWRLTVRDEDSQNEHLGQRSGAGDPERVVLAAGISGRTNVPDDSRYTFSVRSARMCGCCRSRKTLSCSSSARRWKTNRPIPRGRATASNRASSRAALRADFF